MFDSLPASPDGTELQLETGVPEVQLREKIAWEKELTGVYFSPHPAEAIREELEGVVTAPCAMLGYDRVGQEVVVAGMVASVRQTTTREGKPFVVAELEDTSGRVEVTVWPRVHETTRGLWVEGALIVVKGQLRSRDGQLQVSCQQAQRYVQSNGNRRRPRKPRTLSIHLSETQDPAADLSRLAQVLQLLRGQSGEDLVTMVVHSVDGRRTEIDMPGLRVEVTPELEQGLDGLVGAAGFRVE